MSKRLRVKESFDSYRAAVIPANAPGIQVTECRRAFYAGARGLIGILMADLQDGSEPTASDMDMMDEVAAELAAFAKAVLERRA